MSKKSSPRTRSSRKATKRTLSGVRRPRATVTAPATQPAPAPTGWKDRLRRYAPVAAVPNLVIVLVVLVLSFGGILFTTGRFAALPATIAEMWFVSHLVPVTFEGVTIGMLPLLPALAIVAFVARRVHLAVKDRVSILDLYTLLAANIVIPLTLAAIAWLMVWDAAKVFPLDPPPIAIALLHPILVHLVGMALGMGPKLWQALARRIAMPAELVDGATRAATVALRLALAGGVVFLILLAIGYQRFGDVIASYPILSVPGWIGLIAAMLGYLPNAAAFTLSTLLGGNVAAGNANISLFAVDLVPLPVFPLFAAVPGAAPVWAPVLMLIPLAVLIHYVAQRAWTWQLVLSTAVWAGIWTMVFTYATSGILGVYGPTGPTAWIIALLVFAWVAVVAGIAWGVAKLRNRQVLVDETPVEEPEPVEEELADDTEPEEDDTEPEEDDTEPEEEPESDSEPEEYPTRDEEDSSSDTKHD